MAQEFVINGYHTHSFIKAISFSVYTPTNTLRIWCVVYMLSGGIQC